MSGWIVGPFGVDDDAERQNMEPDPTLNAC